MYVNSYRYRAGACSCGYNRYPRANTVYYSRPAANNGLWLAAAGLLLIPLFAWGWGGWYW